MKWWQLASGIREREGNPEECQSSPMVRPVNYRRCSRGRFAPSADRPLLLGPSAVPNAEEPSVPRNATASILEELSNASQADPPSAALPRLLRGCFKLLPDIGNDNLAQWCRHHLFQSLVRVLSRDPSPSLLPAIEVFLGNLDPLNGFLLTRLGLVAPEKYSTQFLIKQRAALELACNHFISSLAGKDEFWPFLNGLSWSGNESQPEIRSHEAFDLLCVTSLFSLPGVVEAHLLLLASRCSSNGADMQSHLLRFQQVMNLYVDRLPALGIFNRAGGVKPFIPKKPLTYSVIQVTRQRLEDKVKNLLSFCQAHASDDLPMSERDIIDISDRLIQENQHLLHRKFRQEAISVVMNIFPKALHCAKENEVHEYNAGMLEEAIRLAALLRLMGSLLVQILHHFSQLGHADDKESANHAALRRALSALCDDTIRLLSYYEANELHRCDFFGTIFQPVHGRRASMQMLSHFASLLVFSVRRRFGFLWRVCIIMMMVTMNLVILEDESMDTFHLLIESAGIHDTAECDLTSAVVPGADIANLQRQIYVRRRSSKAIVSQMTAIRNQSTKEVDGRAFLQCLQGHKYNPTRDADLADFIVCKAGKDYSNALDQQAKFKSWKDKKRLIIAKRRSKDIRRVLCERTDMQRLTWNRKRGDFLPTLPWK